jgi:signal transduction histidine kinase
VSFQEGDGHGYRMHAPALNVPSGGIARRAYLPIPLLLAAMAGLWLADLRESYVALRLTLVLQFLFMTLASCVVAYLASRSFLARGSVGLLLLVCGILFWGFSGVMALVTGRGDFNVSVTVHNLSVWLAAFCHLMGVMLSSQPARGGSQRGWWLLAAYVATAGVLAVVARAAAAGWVPIFFVQGEGGTLVRQIVLGSAIVMFIASTLALRAQYRAVYSSFAHWYALGLALTAAGLFGVLISTVHSSALNWTGVLTQCLSGVYLVAAAFAAARESRAWDISLAVAPSDARLRYALAVMFVAAAVALRLLFHEVLGPRAVPVTFFPAVILAALYGGRGPGTLAALLSAVAIGLLGAGAAGAGEVADLLVVALFVASCVLIVWIAEAIQKVQSRASAAEAQVKLAAERRQALESASRAKDEFLAMLSHELRNPLAALSSAAHVLKLAESGSEAAIKARGVVERQTKHMSRLIGDLLDIGRINAGKLGLERERLDLAEVVSGVVGVWRRSARFQRHLASLAAQPVWVDADRARIEQITANLLDNALKFTPAGRSIAVTVGEEDTAAVLRVSDQGQGLAAGAEDRIFELFVQGDGARGGMGVGLALVRRLVELHGGSVGVSSEGPGHGTTFTVRLPAAARPGDASSPAGPHRAAASRRILIVEDNDDARQMLEAALALGGHEVRTARDGAGGLVLAADLLPDVVLIDIALPDMDGYELARRLRAARGGRRLGLVAVTGYGQPDDQRRAFDAGFDVHLVKPVSAQRLRQVIATLA